jgi:mRNA interferase RelE/StbE
MSQYAITFARSARKELEALSRPLLARVLNRIEALAHDPRPTSCRKLVGQGNLWRIRIGDYRVIYAIDDRSQTVDISVIRHRSDAYR